MKALDNRFYVKFMQLEIGLFFLVYQLRKGNQCLEFCLIVYTI